MNYAIRTPVKALCLISMVAACLATTMSSL